jgi:hypothetical protein
MKMTQPAARSYPGRFNAKSTAVKHTPTVMNAPVKLQRLLL